MLVNHLRILPTRFTPEIKLNPNGKILIKGRSMQGDASMFYQQLEDWIDRYLDSPANITCVDFYMEYLPTNNLKIFVYMLKKLEITRLKNKKLIINWYYESGDEDILEKGECLSSLLSMPFNFIKT